MERTSFSSTSSIKPNAIVGQWTFLVKASSDKTIVGMELANAIGRVAIENPGTSPGEQVFVETHNLTVESTGVFEKEIEKAVNTNKASYTSLANAYR